MISGHGTIDTAVSAIKNGAYDFIEKPFKADRLLLVVDRAVEADRLRRENATLRRRVGGEVGFVGSSGDAASVRAQIERVAPMGSRVLITGASGAGKETVARLIHMGSKRADGPFVVVNCSNPAGGAARNRTVRHRHRVGRRFAPRLRAPSSWLTGGTLLLKEVADLPLSLAEPAGARCCRSNPTARDGGKTRVEVDVRVLASTTPRLQDGDRRRTLPRGVFPSPERRLAAHPTAQRAP
jgi:two-component system nitrogen regulation response regulator NtrX